jgi:hypothetical protein
MIFMARSLALMMRGAHRAAALLNVNMDGVSSMRGGAGACCSGRKGPVYMGKAKA